MMNQPPEHKSPHHALRHALRVIVAHIPEPFTVHEIAREVWAMDANFCTVTTQKMSAMLCELRGRKIARIGKLTVGKVAVFRRLRPEDRNGRPVMVVRATDEDGEYLCAARAKYEASVADRSHDADGEDAELEPTEPKDIAAAATREREYAKVRQTASLHCAGCGATREILYGIRAKGRMIVGRSVTDQQRDVCRKCGAIAWEIINVLKHLTTPDSHVNVVNAQAKIREKRNGNGEHGSSDSHRSAPSTRRRGGRHNRRRRSGVSQNHARALQCC